MPPPPLTVVVVHWNQAARLATSLDRLATQRVDIRPLVVDNGSRPDQLAAVRELVGGPANLLELGENRGFGPAANAGFRRWLDEATDEWVALMPHDALPAEGTLSALLAVATARPRLGLLSADVGDGATPVIDPYFGGITRPAAASEGFEAADHPHGTLMLVRRGVLEEVGLFDERYFAYVEEADLGLRTRAAGWEVGLLRGAEVHNPDVGSHAAEVAYLQLRNTLLLVREHSGRYHVTIRMLFALAQVIRQGEHRRARLVGMGDFLRGRFGAPGPTLRRGHQNYAPVA